MSKLHLPNGIKWAPDSIDTVEKATGLDIHYTEDWKSNSGIFFYEGANTEDYNIPSSTCFVFTILIDSKTRGVAIAFDWNKYNSTDTWINKNHSSAWQGWVQCTHL